MSIPLTVEFDGLTSLVPKKKADENVWATQWLAVLPDLRETFGPTPSWLAENLKKAKESFGDRDKHLRRLMHRPVPPHVACVVVPDEGVDPFNSNKKPTMIFRSPRFSDRLYRLYSFDQEKLVIDSRVNDAEKHLVVDLKEFTSEVPKAPGDEKNLDWVAPLDEMNLEKAEVFNKDLITEDDRPDPNWLNGSSNPPLGLIGTVLFEHGRLTTDGVVTYRKYDKEEVGVYEFRADIGCVHRQAQVDHIVLKDDVASEEVTLEFHGTEGRVELVELLPVAGEFKVSIFNLEIETILDEREGTYPDEGGDPDFATCYALSTGWPFPSCTGKLPIPYPTWTAGGGGRKTCNPGRYEGKGD